RPNGNLPDCTQGSLTSGNTLPKLTTHLTHWFYTIGSKDLNVCGRTGIWPDRLPMWVFFGNWRTRQRCAAGVWL
ncbi:MAG: hypothetical protein ACUVT0_09820, partial [Thermochromatium sp.]